jgi:23S rRNA pseudouridine1911/1915/1917 synthase
VNLAPSPPKLQVIKVPAKAQTPTPPPPQSGAVHLVAVGPDQADTRLDVLLASALGQHGAGLSRSRIKRLIVDGSVQVEGRILSDPDGKVPAGTMIRVAVPEPVADRPKGEALPLSIVYEDADLLVLDKPAGLVVHPGAGHAAGTLVNALIAHCGNTLSGIGGVRRPGIVHRLDKDTSGLLVVAKSDRAHQGLSRIFADHGRSGSLVREYLAFIWGCPDRTNGVIDAPIGRHPHQREKMAVASADKGRRALTHWRQIENFGTVASLVACRLETGRTHQIRVHFAHIDHPLLGDPVYGRGFRTKATKLTPPAQAALRDLNRQALHAAVLGFTHPLTGKTLRFESPLPGDLATLAKRLRAAP